MIDLDEHYLNEVINILKQFAPGCEVWVYGSRINGKSRKYSDLDLVLKNIGKIGWKEIEALKDAFSESDLPFSVDVIDLDSISGDFRKVIENNHEIILKN